MTDPLVLTLGPAYPFDQQVSPQDRSRPVQVQHRVSLTAQPRPVLRQKIRLLKNLGFQHLMGLESTTEDEQFLSLVFEWVPLSLEGQMPHLDAEELDRVRVALVETVENLASHGVDHEFEPKNIGLNRRRQVRYFLGWGFAINSRADKLTLAEKYRRQVERVLDGDFSRQERQVGSEKNDYTETMDTNWKDRLPRPLLKSSDFVSSQQADSDVYRATACADIAGRLKEGLGKVMRTEGDWEEERAAEVRPIKMVELGDRINKLKSMMREVTGKGGVNGLSQVRMQVDQGDQNHQIFEQDRIMITPSYTQFEKKIAEFRERRLLRAYNQKEILFSRDNQGYELKSRQSIQDKHPRLLLSPGRVGLPTSNPKADRAGVTSPVASPKAVVNRTHPLSKPCSRKALQVPSFLHKRKTEPEPEETRTRQNSQQSQQANEERHPLASTAHEYMKMAKNDKYCQEFISLLDGDEPSTPSTPVSLWDLECVEGRERAPMVFKERVEEAIRHSLRLIRGMRGRESAE